jgi:hypothetical protein
MRRRYFSGNEEDILRAVGAEDGGMNERDSETDGRRPVMAPAEDEEEEDEGNH